MLQNTREIRDQQESVRSKLEKHERIINKLVDGSLFRHIDEKIESRMQEYANETFRPQQTNEHFVQMRS